ncbi:MAG TPA: PilT/PilU family type 4a pilus ATPase, partial [Gemmatimonadaceae bacterium]|nr:PilT/PilU family type 4a pilus ATPase [Gemmatimonadaceae bacterium]
MAQIDRLLVPLTSGDQGTLFLAEGKSATIEQGNASRDVTRFPVTAQQMVAILREVAPAEEAERLTRGESVDYTFRSGGVAFRVNASRASGGWSAIVAPAAEERVAGAESPSMGVRGRGRADVDDLLTMTIDRGASDLHLRCGEPPTLRRDGAIERVGDLVLESGEIRTMIEATIPERNRAEFELHGDSDYAYELAGRARFRVNVFTDRRGPAVVFRQIPIHIRTAAELGIPPEVQRLTRLRRGLVLVTGPTGSGKSTTIAALLDLVNETRTDHVITIEDPIEFVHRGKKALISQRQVGEHTASFKSALRAALREDPDVVLIGEMRDLETVAIALETAETGHLVFATLHTSTAASTIDRIIDQFPADQQAQIRVMFADSLKAIIAQTLCRRVDGGRVAAREILFNTPPIANLIREAKTFQIPSIMQTSKRHGMTLLND